MTVLDQARSWILAHRALCLASNGKPALVYTMIKRHLTGLQLLRCDDLALQSLGIADAADRAYLMEHKYPYLSRPWLCSAEGFAS